MKILVAEKGCKDRCLDGGFRIFNTMQEAKAYAISARGGTFYAVWADKPSEKVGRLQWDGSVCIARKWSKDPLRMESLGVS